MSDRSDVFSLVAFDRRGLPGRGAFHARHPATPPAAFYDADAIGMDRLISEPRRSFYVAGAFDDMAFRLRREASQHGAKLDFSKAGDRAITVRFSIPDANPYLDASDARDWCRLWPLEVLFGQAGKSATRPEGSAAIKKIVAALKSSTSDERGRSVTIQQTPSMTAIDILCTMLKSDARFPHLSAEQERIIMWPEQARREVFPRRGMMREFHYSDHRRMYPSIMKAHDFPIGEFHHTITSNFANDYLPSWYLLTAQVPAEWSHIGLVQQNGTWPAKPGTIIRGWYPEPEARLLQRHGWLTGISERLAPEDKSRCLRYFVETIEAIDDACGGDADPLTHGWCREAVLGAVGRLHRASHGGQVTIPESEFDAEEYADAEYVMRKGDDGRTYAIVNVQSRPTNFIAPQVAQHIWALARARITNAMLNVPFENLIGCNLDALYTTTPFRSDWHVARGISDPYRLKGRLTSERPFPRDLAALFAASDLSALEFAASGADHGI